MASSYKYFSDHDRVVATNPLTEAVFSEPTDGTWASNSTSTNYYVQYATGSDFETNYRLFDLTFGRSSVTTGGSTQLSLQHNIYNQYAKILLGHDENNNIRKFSLNPDSTSDDHVLHNAYFMNFDRAYQKDKINKGSVSLKIKVSGAVDIYLVDSGSNGLETRECNTGFYGKLYASASNSDIGSLGDNFVNGATVIGLVFYEAGIAVISPYIFSQSGSALNPSSSNDDLNLNMNGLLRGVAPSLSLYGNIGDLIVDSTIYDICISLASPIVDPICLNKLLEVKFDSVTELNSTVYFCRAYNHEFNYSSNPTYLNNSEIVVKGGDPEIPPRTYITTVGLYSDDNQLLAVAKLSEPLIKTPSTELIARIRLDF